LLYSREDLPQVGFEYDLYGGRKGYRERGIRIGRLTVVLVYVLFCSSWIEYALI